MMINCSHVGYLLVGSQTTICEIKKYQIKINTNAYIGVSQESILGHLLFSIYINDLPKSCSKLNCIMFDDNITLYF